MLHRIRRHADAVSFFGLAAIATIPASACGQRATTAPDTTFAAMVHRLSEPGGYFDSDNIISNERSLQHALGALRRRPLTGGAYIGVGPDQNFTYIAELRPSIAFIVDIRRDNLLQHLMFRTLFEEAATRGEWLALLVGRPAPPKAFADSSIERIVAWIDAAAPDRDRVSAARRMMRRRLASYGVPLDSTDRATIERIHETFVAAGLDLKFSSHWRGPRPYYPNYRDLLLERDLEGTQSGFLASEERYRRLRELQQAGRIVPVVGDFAGDHALAAIGGEIRRRGLTLTAFYTSNVEFYLMRNDAFARFADNVAGLPYTDQSVIVRSYFSGGFRPPLEQTVPGYASTQLVQPVSFFVAEHRRGGYQSYADVVTSGILSP